MKKVFFFFSLIGIISGFPSGAPDDSCVDLKPQHGADFSNAPNIYELNRTDFNTTHIIVNFGAKNSSEKMEGFLLQARCSNNSYQNCGSFQLNNLVKYACGNSPSAVTQSAELNENRMSLIWAKPVSFNGNVTFVITIVRRKVTFWKMQNPTEASTTFTVSTISPTSTSIYSAVDFSQCGVQKSCFIPNCNTIGINCENAITWSDGGTSVQFELKGKLINGDKYLSLGLSQDEKMGDDSVISCVTKSDGTVAVYLSLNNGYSSNRASNQSALIQNKWSGSFVDGIMICRFSIAKKTKSRKRAISDFYYPDGQYNLFLAKGQGYGDQIGKHSSTPIISKKLDLTNFTILSITSTLNAVDFSQCGVQKSCFAPNCDKIGSNCENAITWSDGGASVQFELKGKLMNGDKYLSLGLSQDEKMGDDSVINCVTKSDGTVIVYLSLNNGYSSSRASNQSALIQNNWSGSFVDGIMICRFSIVKKTKSRKRAISDFYYPDGQYNLFLAKGQVSGDQITKHSSTPIISEKLDLTKFTILSISQIPKNIGLLKAHGIIMVLAWLIFASSGILMPRYFKPTWNESTPCIQKPLWFILHVAFMILVFCLQITAFIIIFCYARDYVGDFKWPADAHPVLGIVTMILVLANPIMAAFRCAPQSNHRWIFNLFHFLVGQGAFFTANICIYLAMRIEEINMPYWCIWVLVAHTVFQIIVEIILSVCNKYLSGQVFEKRLDSGDGNMMAIASDPYENKATLPKSLFMFFHFIVVTGFAIAISVGIGQIVVS